MKINLTITDAKKIDKNKWSDFVYNHPHGNIFQAPKMYEVYQNTKNYAPVFLAVVNGVRYQEHYWRLFKKNILASWESLLPDKLSMAVLL